MAITYFTWDTVNDSYLMETDQSGAPTVIYSQEPSQYGALVSLNRGGIPSYCHTDGFDSIRCVTDSSQLVTDTYAFDSWGGEIERTGTTDLSFRWAGSYGYYFDSRAGEYYVRARRYRSSEGRWLSQDPLGFLNGVNLYIAQPLQDGGDPSGMIPNAPMDRGGSQCVPGRPPFNCLSKPYSGAATYMPPFVLAAGPLPTIPPAGNYSIVVNSWSYAGAINLCSDCCQNADGSTRTVPFVSVKGSALISVGINGSLGYQLNKSVNLPRKGTASFKGGFLLVGNLVLNGSGKFDATLSSCIKNKVTTAVCVSIDGKLTLSAFGGVTITVVLNQQQAPLVDFDKSAKAEAVFNLGRGELCIGLNEQGFVGQFAFTRPSLTRASFWARACANSPLFAKMKLQMCKVLNLLR